MMIREFLRSELWNKRTSRKVFVAFGIFLGVVIVGFLLWSILDRNWITPGERIAAAKAMVQLDRLQDTGHFVTLDIGDFIARTHPADREIEEAQRAARTTRDRMIVKELKNYQSATVEDYYLVRRQLLAQQQNSSHSPGQWMKGFGIAGIGFDSRGLHKALD